MADAGWYTDPRDPRGLRWFDGTSWTDRVAPNPAVTPVPDQAPGLVSHPGLTGAGRVWYYVLAVLGAGSLYFAKVSARKALSEIGAVERLTGWEVFWYYLHCLAFGEAYFMKIDYKRALADAGHTSLSGVERFWYGVSLIPFGLGYFVKLAAAKALDDAGAGSLTPAQQRWYALLCGDLAGGYFAKLPVARALEQSSPLAFRSRGARISRASRIVFGALGALVFVATVVSDAHLFTAPGSVEYGAAPTRAQVEMQAAEEWDLSDPFAAGSRVSCDYYDAAQWAPGYRFTCLVSGSGIPGGQTSILGTVTAGPVGDELLFTRG